MYDDSALTEALFGTKKKKRSRQTAWNEEVMFAGKENDTDDLKPRTENSIPIDPDDSTVIDTKKIRLARKLTYGKTKKLSVAEYMQKLRDQYLLIYQQPKWALIDDDFGKSQQLDTLCLLLTHL